MSIETIVEYRTRRERGYDDPSYPIGVWECSGRVTGDSSGTAMRVFMALKPAGVQPGNAFSLEQYALVNADHTLGPVSLQLSGMEIPGPGTQTIEYYIDAQNFSVTTDDAAPITSPKLFLGMAPYQAVAGGLQWSLANSSGQNFDVWARGYIWGPRSILQSVGGYRRPSDGMFSQ